MSGAGVLLPDGRLTAVVVAAESGHQQRRLYVVPLAPALATAPDLAAALATVTGAAVVVEAQSAPAYQRLLYRDSLRADGTPLQLGEINDLGVFGVKPVDLAGEPVYLNYVPRDDDGRLGAALSEAIAARQALLLVGDSGSGKTRSAAQPDAARRWWEQAAAAGDAHAMNNLGLLLKDRDPDTARRWYEQAAAGGQTDAMNTLGVLLVSEGDPDAARCWWEQAAEHGHAVAMYNLGVLLEDRDPDAARRWYEQAATQVTPARGTTRGLIE
jgi:TPR repeat protein